MCHPANIVMSQEIPDVPGKTLTALLVHYEPGGKTPRHHLPAAHGLFVSGAVRSQNSATGPARVYYAGEAFYEPPGSEHLVSENASATEPASLLAVFVADDGATLRVDDP